MAKYEIFKCEYCDNALSRVDKFCSGCGKANPYYQLLPISDLDNDVAKKLVRENEKAKFAEHKAKELTGKIAQRYAALDDNFRKIDAWERTSSYANYFKEIDRDRICESVEAIRHFSWTENPRQRTTTIKADGFTEVCLRLITAG